MAQDRDQQQKAVNTGMNLRVASKAIGFFNDRAIMVSKVSVIKSTD
jgi:hypothetical protein